MLIVVISSLLLFFPSDVTHSSAIESKTITSTAVESNTITFAASESKSITSTATKSKTITSATANSFVWGRDGHAITADIAREHMTEKTLQEVTNLLRDMTLAEASVWMDVVRPQDAYAHTRDWHWVTIPGGETYEESEKNPNGDAVSALEEHINGLKSGSLDTTQRAEALKIVIHLVGDIHQPLHVGTGEDRGGNDVRLNYLGRDTNLHSLWDTQMIRSYQIAVGQWVTALNLPTPAEVEAWQKASVRDWAHESMTYREFMYDLPEDLTIGWDYRNRYFNIVEKRLLQAGVRMAGVLNDIFDPQP